jgi:serine/threonine protein kinase
MLLQLQDPPPDARATVATRSLISYAPRVSELYNANPNGFSSSSEGSSQYMAPEQLQGGDNQYDQRVDVYALGIILMLLV